MFIEGNFGERLAGLVGLLHGNDFSSLIRVCAKKKYTPLLSLPSSNLSLLAQSAWAGGYKQAELLGWPAGTQKKVGGGV